MSRPRKCAVYFFAKEINMIITLFTLSDLRGGKKPYFDISTIWIRMSKFNQIARLNSKQVFNTDDITIWPGLYTRSYIWLVFHAFLGWGGVGGWTTHNASAPSLSADTLNSQGYQTAHTLHCFPSALAVYLRRQHGSQRDGSGHLMALAKQKWTGRCKQRVRKECREVSMEHEKASGFQQDRDPRWPLPQDD